MAENFFGITDTGKQRTNNEDTFIAEKVLHDQYIMACVIDGVGGYSGGEVAASMARQSVLDYFRVPSGDVITMMKEALLAANKKIYKERQKNEANGQMACVLTIAIADTLNKLFYFAHVGDTRLYLFRDASLVKVTKDHSFVGFLEDTGRLSEEDAMIHPKRNEINKALGFDEQVAFGSDYIETGSSPFLPGDLLLLCSDGLTDMINKGAIAEIINAQKTLEEIGTNLIAAANQAGGKDNITVVLVHNQEAPVKLKATRPKLVKKKGYQKKELTASEPENIPPVKNRKPAAKNTKTPIVLLSLLCCILAGALAWMWYYKNPSQKPVSTVPPISISPIENELKDSLSNFTGGTFILKDSLFGNPFILNDTIIVSKDSLHLKGIQNFVFRADSVFKGPAIMTTPSNKYLRLENITFENFDVAIDARNKNLHFKNVRFINCRIPVLNSYYLPNDQNISGSLQDSFLFKRDSLPK